MRYWSVPLAIAAVCGAGAFISGPIADGWAPFDSAGGLHRVGATFASATNGLFLLVLVLASLAFIGILIAAGWAQLRAHGRTNRRWSGQGIEAAWSIVPAAILGLIVVHETDALAAIRFRSAAPRVPVRAELTGEQFQWNVKYPGPDGVLDTADDLRAVNELHVVKNQATLIHLRSADVIHSFFLPRLRIKQDATPGATIPVRFEFDAAGRFELVCAGICGWGHYTMRGEVVVHETEADFQRWQAGQAAGEPGEDRR